MGEILGVGLSHYPGPLVPTERWPDMLKRWVAMGRVKAEDYAAKDRWPEPMRQEWGSDDGQSAARHHHDLLAEGYAELRRQLDIFAPDVVVIFGDDQFENYKRDCIPAFALGIFDEVIARPFGGSEPVFRTSENAWHVDPDTPYRVACHREAALQLTRTLLEKGQNVGYSLSVRHPAGLAHSFANTLLFLDPTLAGFPFPIVPVHLNCYGNQLLSTSAGAVGEGTNMVSPPSPSPRTCFDLGRAVARFFQGSSWRACIIGSASWSHASLTPKHGRLYPDVEADRKLLEQLRSGRFRDWGDLDPAGLDDAGQHELLNWIALAGAMTEVDQDAEIVNYAETFVFNSTKCFAVFATAPRHGGEGL